MSDDRTPYQQQYQRNDEYNPGECEYCEKRGHYEDVCRTKIAEQDSESYHWNSQEQERGRNRYNNNHSNDNYNYNRQKCTECGKGYHHAVDCYSNHTFLHYGEQSRHLTIHCTTEPNDGSNEYQDNSEYHDDDEYQDSEYHDSDNNNSEDNGGYYRRRNSADESTYYDGAYDENDTVQPTVNANTDKKQQHNNSTHADESETPVGLNYNGDDSQYYDGPYDVNDTPFLNMFQADHDIKDQELNLETIYNPAPVIVHTYTTHSEPDTSQTRSQADAQRVSESRRKIDALMQAQLDAEWQLIMEADEADRKKLDENVSESGDDDDVPESSVNTHADNDVFIIQQADQAKTVPEQTYCNLKQELRDFATAMTDEELKIILEKIPFPESPPVQIKIQLLENTFRDPVMAGFEEELKANILTEADFLFDLASRSRTRRINY